MSVKSKKSSRSDSAAIINLYHLFARLLAEELDAEVVEVLRKPEVLEFFTRVEPNVEDYLETIDFEAAAADFCAIFILPGKQQHSPRAIAWLGEGDDVSANGIHAVVDVFQKNMNLELPDFCKALPLDHAAVLFQMAAELRVVDSPQVEEFEQTVLGTWVHLFANQLSQCDVSIYRALGKLIRSSQELAA